jgi:hypothetical protein
MKMDKWMTAAALSAAITVAEAGDLTVEGALNVTSNLAARTLSVTNAAVGALVVEGPAVFAGPLAGDGSAITNLAGANLAPGSVGAASLAAGAVSADKIPAGAISGAHIAAGAAIDPSRIAGLTNTLGSLNAHAEAVAGLLEAHTTDANIHLTEEQIAKLDSVPATEADLAALRMYHYGSPEIVESPAEWFRNHPDVPSMIGFTLTPEIITNWNIVVPWQLNGVEVRKIMTGYCRDIKSIRLPKTITHIEQNSFSECTSLCSVVYNGNVDYVGYGAFSLCPSLTNVTFCCNQPVFDEQDWFYMTHSDCVITVLNPQATGWGDTLSDGYRSIPVVRPALYADAVYQAGQLLATTGDVAQALSSLYPSANPSNYVSASAVDGIVAAATANLLASTGSGSQLTGITAAQVGAYTVNETDAAISSALAGFNPDSCVQTNHMGNVSIQGGISASTIAGNGSALTNLNLAAYVGSNLVWDAASNKLHAAASGSVYTDADAVAAVTGNSVDMSGHSITGLADATADTDAVNRQTVTNLIQQALLHVGPFGNLSMGAFTAQ